ncbi:MAG: alkyl sulfatase dimerization domain-containing protein [Saprospiraceae bacterium]
MKKPFYLFLLFSLMFSCQSKRENVTFEKSISSVEDLVKHSEEFVTPEVIEVVEGVHVAIGFGLANSILIEGAKGNIIVDCMESNESAAKVKAAFNQISSKPIKALIYTHNHADHIFGAGTMAGEDNPEIYSHELTNYYIDRLLNVVRPIIGERSGRMFGTSLDDKSHVNCGIGPRLDANENTTRSLLRPTVTFKNELEVEIEGIKLKLIHAPGETNDQLFVWIADRKILLPGDNIYKAFPNLYTIRGTSYRDVKMWSASLDKMRFLNPEILIPSHTRPIKGAENIQGILRDYRDAIQFVHDQTIRNINKGLTPDELAEKVILPEHLSSSPYLQEFYGRVDWSVKSIFSGYLGWFDGKSSTLLPLPLKEKAEKMAALAGGQNQLWDKAVTASQNNEYQWALELADYLKRLSPNDSKIDDLRRECLIALGEKQSNPNARNYYLSQALETKGELVRIDGVRSVKMIHQIPLEAMFNSMSVRLVPEKSIDYDKKAVFHFTDTNEKWTVHIRKGVAEIQSFALENPDLTISTTSIIWKEIVAKVRNPKLAIAKGDLSIEGGMGAFGEFMGMFVEE